MSFGSGRPSVKVEGALPKSSIGAVFVRLARIISLVKTRERGRRKRKKRDSAC